MGKSAYSWRREQSHKHHESLPTTRLAFQTAVCTGLLPRQIRPLLGSRVPALSGRRELRY